MTRLLRLITLEGRFAVCRLDADSRVRIPTEATFFSMTRTTDELSIICPESDAPESDALEGAKVESGWRAIKVEGPLGFSEVGVISALTAPLAEAEVPVFVVSTFDTDYVLVKEANLERTVSALEEAGHEVSG